jgi:hypothetical protein
MNSYFSAPEVTSGRELDGTRQLIVDLLIAEDAARWRAATMDKEVRQAQSDLDGLVMLLEASEEGQLVAGLTAISCFAVWISVPRTLVGLLRRSSARATLALKSAMHSHQVPGQLADMDWLQNKRVLLGLLRRRLLDGSRTTQSVVFTQMACEFLWKTSR